MKMNVSTSFFGLLAAFALAFIFTACPNPNSNDGRDPALTGTVTIEKQGAAGEIIAGNTLKAVVSGSNATTFKYQWQKRTGTSGSFSNIDGKTAETYVVDVAVDDYIRVVVTAVGFNGSKESDAVRIVSPDNPDPDPDPDPALTGTLTIQRNGAAVTVSEAADGDTLKAFVTDSNASAFLYQWQKRVGTSGEWGNIEHENTDIYIVAADVDDWIRVVITANGYTGGIDSSAFKVINPNDPAITGIVTIQKLEGTGDIRIGDTVKALVTGSNASADALGYQWRKGTSAGGPFTDIGDGNTEDTYTILATDLAANDYLQMVVTAHGFTSEIVSDPVQVLAELFEVTFNANNGTLSEGTPAAMLVEDGGNLVLFENDAYVYSATRTDGYVFMGWYVSTDTDRTVVESVTVTGPITLTAKWGRTITFDPNGGTLSPGTPSTVTVEAGVAFSLIDVTGAEIYRATRANNAFQGWSTTANGSRVTSVTLTTSDRTLYARWISGITITLDLDGGYFRPEDLPNVEMVSVVQSGSNNYYAPSPIPLKDSVGNTEYIFANWQRSDTNAKVTTGEPITVTSNITLKAIWASPYTVTLDLDGGTLLDTWGNPVPLTHKVIPGGIFRKPYPDPAKTGGNSFNGWYNVTTSSNVVWNVDNLNSITVNSNITLKALWTPGYTIRYELNGGGFFNWDGSPNTAISLTYIVAPGTTYYASFYEDPEKEGYVFGGWFRDEALTIPKPDSVVVNSDLTFYAAWIGPEIFGVYTSPGGDSYLLRTTYDGLSGGYFSNTSIRWVDWNLSSIDGSPATITAAAITVGGVTYARVTDNKKTPAYNAGVSGTTWTQGIAELRLDAFTTNGFAQISDANWEYVGFNLGYVVEGNTLYLVEMVGDRWGVLEAGAVVLDIPLNGNNLQGWSKQ